MRIIKKGKKPKAQEYIKKCRYCKTLFAYKEDDIFTDVDTIEWMYCPHCNSTVLVSFFKKKYKGDSNES